MSGSTKVSGHRKTGRARGGNAPAAGTVNERSQDPHADERRHATGTEGLALHEIPRTEEGFDERESPLFAPPAQPGMCQRWIRVRLGQGQDSRNIQSAVRGGWRPRLLNTVGPEHSPPTTFLDGHEYIGVDDLVLMERPIALDKKEKEQDEKLIQRRTEAVVRQLDNAQQPGGPPIQVGHRTTVTRGKRRPVVQRSASDDLADVDADVEGGEEMDLG